MSNPSIRSGAASLTCSVLTG